MQHEMIIVQRNGLRREGLARLFNKSPFRIVACLSPFDDQALSCLTQEPKLFLVDVGEDGDAGVHAIKCLNDRQSAARIVALAECSDVDVGISAFRAGANAYLVEVGSCDALIKSLELVMLGQTIMPFQTLSAILAQNRCSPSSAGEKTEAGVSTVTILSAREKHVLGCLADGNSNKVIARQVGAAEATVKVHVKSILRKIGVQNRTQAAIWAINYRASLPPQSNARGQAGE